MTKKKENQNYDKIINKHDYPSFNSLHLFRHFIAHVPFATLMLNEALECIDVNNEAISFFNKSKKSILGKYINELCTGYNPNTSGEQKVLIKDSNFSPSSVLLKTYSYTIDNKTVSLVQITNKYLPFEAGIDTLLKLSESNALFNNPLFGIVILGKDRRIRRANKRCADIMGYASTEELINKSMREFYISDEDYNRFDNLYVKDFVNHKLIQMDYQFRQRSGKLIWTTVSGTAIDPCIPPDIDKGVIWIIEDITKRINTLQQLEIAHSELEVIFSNSMVGIIFLKGGRKIYRANQCFADIMGYETAEELIGKSVINFHLSRKNFKEFGLRYYNNLINNKMVSVDYQFRKKDGSPIWIAISGKAIDNNIPPNLDKGVIWTIKDISERKQIEQKLLQLATIDPLTGLYNRHKFMELGQQEFDKYNKNKNHSLCLLMLDIDHFKVVNDTYGHQCGDKTLSHFASTCKSCLRPNDYIGRIGGEEFAVLLPNTNLDESIIIGERIRSKVESSKADNIPSITVSIGISSTDSANSLSELLHIADTRLYSAKDQGRNRVIAQ
ncbi:MAG: diguanylate cyclase [Vallitalea sp.]|jgi:diguanylate cyclase (GGDEF)-like protein/PAS domain S-box-containing protein|nr:diguanylate cyclase [Vallitalea sp.]